jgi:hypothetical protein
MINLASPLSILSIPSAAMLLAMVLGGHIRWIDELRVTSDVQNAKQATIAQQQADIEIARQRFDQGCYQITAPNSNGTAVQISQNMPIFGHSTTKSPVPLADGTVVCDLYGGTGVIQGGRVQHFAANPGYASPQTRPSPTPPENTH